VPGPRRLLGVAAAGLVLMLGACERGCARSALESGSPGKAVRGLEALSSMDCPDGLARCEAAGVAVSRRATLPGSCRAPSPACTCPWEGVGECPNGCVAEGLELVVDAPLAAAQLCNPAGEAGALAGPWSGPTVPPTECDDGEGYRCRAGVVVDCRSRAPVGQCAHGCYRDGASTPDEGVVREQAFALLCSR
jgi:hypothetical protein